MYACTVYAKMLEKETETAEALRFCHNFIIGGVSCRTAAAINSLCIDVDAINFSFTVVGTRPLWTLYINFPNILTQRLHFISKGFVVCKLE